MTRTSTKTRADAPEVGPRKTPPMMLGDEKGFILINEKEGMDRLICGPIKATMAARTSQGKQWEFHFCFPDLDGLPRTVAISAKDLASDHRAVAALCADAGLPIGDAPMWALPQLLQHMGQNLPFDQRGTLVEGPGFHELPNGDLAFATPDGKTIRADPTKDGPVLVLADPVGPQLGGDLAGLKAAAAAAVRTRLDHLAAGLLMGVAGMVVDFAELDSSPIIALVGTTSSGKTTTAQLAASMTGPHIGTGSRFGSLATTPNAIEGRLAATNGSFFAGDETTSFPRERLQELIFSIASGEGKARMKSDASLRTVRRWRTFAAVTTEVPLRDLMRGADGREPRAGAAVRAASIDTSGARRLTTAELEALNGYKTNFGHALEPVARILLRSTISDPDARAALRREIGTRAADLAGSEAASLTVRSAGVFAVLAVAGRLLREAAITPADFDADALIARLWTAFQSSADAPADPVETAIKRFTEALYAGRGSRIVPVASAEGERFREPLAYFEVRGDHLCFFVPVSNVNELSGGGAADKIVARALRDSGQLETPDQSGRLANRRIPHVGSISHYRIILPMPDIAEAAFSGRLSALNPGSLSQPTSMPHGNGNVVPLGGQRRTPKM